MKRLSLKLHNKVFITALLLTLCSCVKSGLDESFLCPSDYISFRASLVADTRTASCGTASYISIEEQSWPLGTHNDSTRGEPVYTLNGLNVGMFASKYDADNRYQGDVMSNLNFQFIDNEELRAVGTPVLWDSVSDAATMKVYGYAPIVDDSDENIDITSSSGVTTISYVVPEAVTDQVDIIATRISEVSSDYRQNIPLTFEHILTGVRFKAGFDCTVTGLEIKSVYNDGDYIFGEVWTVDAAAALSNFTIPIEAQGRQCTAGSYITSGSETLMMIPQQLPDAAVVVMTYKESNGVVGTITASLEGMTWEQGSLITYTIHKNIPQNYVYFDLYAGNVALTPTSYQGYVFVDGVKREVAKTWTVDQMAENVYHYYVYQSTEVNKKQYGYASIADYNNFTNCRIPEYEPIMVGNQLWSDYITNNTCVEDVIEVWDDGKYIRTDGSSAPGERRVGEAVVRDVGRTHTRNYISVTGQNATYYLTIDNIYSVIQHSESRNRSVGGISYTPTGNTTLTVNMVGDNRMGCLHINNKSTDRIDIGGTGSLTVADTDFLTKIGPGGNDYYGDVENYGYVSNLQNSAIGNNTYDGCENLYGFYVNSGVVYAGTTKTENCTAIGGGGNGFGQVFITGGTVTAVATTAGTAIGGGMGHDSHGGPGEVHITGGNVYAYNFANRWGISSSAVGGGGSVKATGSSGNVTISGGYVYAYSALGTAIGGGSSLSINGGSTNLKISGGYIIAKSATSVCIGGGTGGTKMISEGVWASGGSATITISGNPIIRTGSIGGGKTNNPNGRIGHATINITGGDISAQFVMAGGAGAGNISRFTMSGGTISNSDVYSKEYYHVTNNGGAVYMEDGYFTMTGGTIRNCTSEVGGAVYIKKSNNALVAPQFNMSGGVINDCVSKTHGGAIYLEGGAVTLSAGTIQRNLALEGNGGGVYIAAGNLKMPEGGSANVIYNSAQLGQTYTLGNGGGIYVTSSTNEVDVEVYSGSIMHNTSDIHGGGICVDMSGNDSVANVVVGSAGSTSVDNPDISKNTAVMYGGGLYAIGENAMVTINSGRIMDNYVANYVSNENVTNQHGTVVLNGGDVTHVVVTFDANAPDATVDGASEAYQNIVTATNSFLVQPLSIQRDLYNFVNWNTRPDGMGVTYTDGQLMNISEDMTLYAQWVAQ